MNSISPLSAISLVIEQVRTSAHANAGLLKNNEAATRAALIDPLLRALGWNTNDVQLVEPERTVGNKQTLDYLLKDAQGRITSIIEAKKLGESLDKIGHVGALIGYAFSLKPQIFFITDGLNWHCYSPTHSHYQPIEILNLETANPVEAALQMIRWLDAAQSGHGIQVVTSIEATGIQASQLLKASTLKPAGRLPPPKKSKNQTVDFIEVSQLNIANLPAGQKPKKLRLPNGTIKPISIWKDVLLEVCGLLLKTNPNLSIPFPDKAGKSRFMFSNSKPEKGASSISSYKGKAIFIGTHYSASDCIANALYASQQLPPNQQTNTLAVSF